MVCEKIIGEICFVKPLGSSGASIFGFSEFIMALALLVIVFTVQDVRYRFRVAVVPSSFSASSFFRLTFWFIGIIGTLTLLTDIWLKEKWLVPESLISSSMWQGMLGFFFLLLAMTWIYYAYINPPKFCEKNFKKFAQELYKIVLKGSNAELPIIANELVRSAEPLVRFARQFPSKNNPNTKQGKKNPSSEINDWAYDVILMLGNRKLCKHIIESSPVTAMAFFDTMSTMEKYDIPIGPFAENISTEAIINKDSILYHEDEGFNSGLIGYLKPFSQAIYGNYRLVEALAHNHHSPLDIDYRILNSWDASQLEAYCRAVTITIKSYLETGGPHNFEHSYALYRALKNIKDSSCRDVYKLNDISSDYYTTEIYRRLGVAVDFVKETINLMDQQKNLPPPAKRRVSKGKQLDCYDHIADVMFEIIFAAATVKAPPDICWGIHHNTVWFPFFGLSNDGKSWEIIHFKLRRLLFDEIRELEGFPNYKGSRVLGFCLNVMGFNANKKTKIDRSYASLRKAVHSWTRNNYLKLRSVQPDVAESCLLGNISFDEKTSSLVATSAKGLSLEIPKVFFQLK